MLKTGIIGYGRMGKIREGEMKKNGQYKLVSIADNRSDLTNITNDSINVYSDYNEMIDGEDLDCVFVCTPHSVIPKNVVDCVNRGIHTFAEKPPGTCLKDVEMMKVSSENNPECKLKFGFNHRYYQHVSKTKEILSTGKLGKIMWMRGVYSKSGLENWRPNKKLAGRGILLGQGIHVVDLFRYFSNNEFEEAKGLISYFEDSEKCIEDNAFVLLRAKNGVVASLHSSSVMWKRMFEINIGLEKGYINLKGLTTPTKSYGYPEQVVVSYKKDTEFVGNPKEEVFYFGKDNSWAQEIKDFADNIQKDQTVIGGSVQDAYEVMKLLEMTYQDGVKNECLHQKVY